MNLPTGGRRYPSIFLFIFPCVCLSACKFAINDVSTCLFGSASIYFLIGVFTCTYLSIYLPIYVWVMLLYAKDQVVEYSVGIFSLGIRADCIPSADLANVPGFGRLQQDVVQEGNLEVYPRTVDTWMVQFCAGEFALMGATTNGARTTMEGNSLYGRPKRLTAWLNLNPLGESIGLIHVDAFLNRFSSTQMRIAVDVSTQTRKIQQGSGSHETSKFTVPHRHEHPHEF